MQMNIAIILNWQKRTGPERAANHVNKRLFGDFYEISGVFTGLCEL